MTVRNPLWAVGAETVEEHRRLNRVTRELRAALEHPGGSGAGRTALAEKLDELQGLLEPHFTFEEESGLFEQITEARPGRARECAHLRAEHGKLLERLALLQMETPDPLSREASARWLAGLRGLLEALAAHESREAELLMDCLDPEAPAAD